MAEKPTTTAKKTKRPAVTSPRKITFAEWVDERKKMTEEEIFAIEAKTQGLKEAKPITFAEWVDERKKMTEEEIFAIEAETQRLKQVEPMTFAEWVDERKKMTEEEIFAIEAKTQGLKQVEPMTFAEWVDERKKMTEEEIFDIEAETQRLKEIKPMTFAGWVDERSKMTEEEIFAIEAKTQGLKEIKQIKISPQKITRPAPDLLIQRTPYPKWWNDLIVGSINIVGSGTQIVVGGKGGRNLYVATIALVVTAETNISFGFGGSPGSGPMLLGGETQPSGIVISMSDSPAPCGSGGFSVSSIGVDPLLPPTVGGFAVCFSEAHILPA